MNDLFSQFSEFPFELLFKIPTLFIIFLFVIFMLIAYTQVRSLDRLVHIKASGESFIIQTIFLLYFLLTVSLFVLALVIL